MRGWFVRQEPLKRRGAVFHVDINNHLISEVSGEIKYDGKLHDVE